MITPFQQPGTSAAHARSTAPAAGHLRAGTFVVMAALGLVAMDSAHAVDIPALPEVQPAVAATHPVLVQRRETLLHERKALLDRTNSHNQSCSAVEDGSAAEASCTKAYPVLEKAINSHVQASRQYNDDYLAAVNLAASKKAAPPPPAGAGARNAASALPESLDNAIAGAYASAPPGVSERVHKGFQAVMVRDWKVAKAWFQEALKRDPSNAGLKRLVALTDSPQQADRQPATVDARNEPAGLGGKSDFKGAFAPPGRTKSTPASTIDPNLQLPDPNGVYLMFPGLKAMEDRQVLDYLFGLNAQPPASKTGKTK